MIMIMIIMEEEVEESRDFIIAQFSIELCEENEKKGKSFISKMILIFIVKRK